MCHLLTNAILFCVGMRERENLLGELDTSRGKGGQRVFSNRENGQKDEEEDQERECIIVRVKRVWK